MPGPAPKENRRRANEPASGEWRSAPGVGWLHGDVPDPPDGLLEPSRVAWETWFGAWFASFWSPADLPGLRQLIRLYDQVEREEFQRAAELRLQMTAYGITPEGQQKRHWKPPRGVDEPRVRRSAGGRRESSLEVIQGGG
jgi:hypothetical protein